MVIKGTLLLFIAVGPGLTFISPKSNETKLKYESCLCKR